MARAILSHKLIFRPRQRTVACQPIEFGTKIARRPGTGQSREILLVRNRLMDDYRARRIHPAIQIDSRQHSLKCVDEEALLGTSTGGFLTAAKVKMTAQIQTMSGGKQMRGADQMVFQQRELALIEIGEACEQPFAHQPAKYRIAKEFEPLVIRAAFRRRGRTRLCETRQLISARTMG